MMFDQAGKVGDWLQLANGRRLFPMSLPLLELGYSGQRPIGKAVGRYYPRWIRGSSHDSDEDAVIGKEIRALAEGCDIEADSATADAEKLIAFDSAKKL
jgi:hypothetical protein